MPLCKKLSKEEKYVFIKELIQYLKATFKFGYHLGQTAFTSSPNSPSLPSKAEDGSAPPAKVFPLLMWANKVGFLNEQNEIIPDAQAEILKLVDDFSAEYGDQEIPKGCLCQMVGFLQVSVRFFHIQANVFCMLSGKGSMVFINGQCKGIGDLLENIKELEQYTKSIRHQNYLSENDERIILMYCTFLRFCMMGLANRGILVEKSSFQGYKHEFLLDQKYSVAIEDIMALSHGQALISPREFYSALCLCYLGEFVCDFSNKELIEKSANAFLQLSQNAESLNLDDDLSKLFSDVGICFRDLEFKKARGEITQIALDMAKVKFFSIIGRVNFSNFPKTGKLFEEFKRQLKPETRRKINEKLGEGFRASAAASTSATVLSEARLPDEDARLVDVSRGQKQKSNPPKLQSKSKPTAKSKSKSKVEPKPKPEIATESDPKPESKSKVKSKSEAKPEIRTKPKPESKSKPESKPALKPRSALLAAVQLGEQSDIENPPAKGVKQSETRRPDAIAANSIETLGRSSSSSSSPPLSPKKQQTPAPLPAVVPVTVVPTTVTSVEQLFYTAAPFVPKYFFKPRNTQTTPPLTPAKSGVAVSSTPSSKELVAIVDLFSMQGSKNQVLHDAAQRILQVLDLVGLMKKACGDKLCAKDDQVVLEVGITGGVARNAIFHDRAIKPSDTDVVIVIRGRVIPPKIIEFLRQQKYEKTKIQGMEVYHSNSSNTDLTFNFSEAPKCSQPCFGIDLLQLNLGEQITYIQPRMEELLQVVGCVSQTNEEKFLELVTKNPQAIPRILRLMYIYDLYDEHLLSSINKCATLILSGLNFGEFKAVLMKFFMRGYASDFMSRGVAAKAPDIRNTFLTLIKPAFPAFCRISEPPVPYSRLDLSVQKFVLERLRQVDVQITEGQYPRVYGIFTLLIFPAFVDRYQNFLQQVRDYVLSRLLPAVKVFVLDVFMNLPKVLGTQKQDGGVGQEIQQWLESVRSDRSSLRDITTQIADTLLFLSGEFKKSAAFYSITGSQPPVIGECSSAVLRDHPKIAITAEAGKLCH